MPRMPLPVRPCCIPVCVPGNIYMCTRHNFYLKCAPNNFITWLFVNAPETFCTVQLPTFPLHSNLSVKSFCEILLIVRFCRHSRIRVKGKRQSWSWCWQRSWEILSAAMPWSCRRECFPSTLTLPRPPSLLLDSLPTSNSERGLHEQGWGCFPFRGWALNCCWIGSTHVFFIPGLTLCCWFKFPVGNYKYEI